MKKALSLFMSIVMLISITAGLNLKVFAEELSGSCGENVTYTLNTETGLLTISGTGPMMDFDFYSDSPWYSNRDSIKTIVIENGVTSIGNFAFYNCFRLLRLTSIMIPNSVTSIGISAFEHCGITDVYYSGTQQEWNSISIGDGNYYLINATIHYTAVSIDNEETAMPNAPTISKLSKGKKSFKATWKKLTGVNGYQIQYSTDKKFVKNTKTVTIKKNAASATVKKLKANKKYYVRVRSYKNAKMYGEPFIFYSPWSKVKSVKIK